MAALFGVAGLAAGLYLARMGSTTTEQPTRATGSSIASPEPREIRVVQVPTQAGLSEGDKSELRELLRDELRSGAAPAIPAEAGPPPSASADPKKLIERLTSEQRITYERAQSIVQERMASGAWTNGDRDTFRQNAAGLPGDVMLEIVRPLINAVNTNQVQFEGRGPLF